MNVEESKETLGNPKATSLLQKMIVQKQLKNVKYFNYMVSMLTNHARCTHEINLGLLW
jgi:hypothetical protein